MTYASLADFYKGRHDRAASLEIDAGYVHDDEGAEWVLCWIKETCEVYAVRMTSGEQPVHLLGTLPAIEDVRKCFDGIQRRGPEAGSLAWAQTAVEFYAAPEPPPVVQGRDW